MEENFRELPSLPQSMRKLVIQAISYIKIPAEIKSARKNLRMLPDSQNLRNFPSADNFHYTVHCLNYTCLCPLPIDLLAGLHISCFCVTHSGLL